MILKSFWVKSHKFSRLTHRLLQMDPDDILWLMQSQRKCCSCEERIPSSCRGINTELLLWGATGTSAMLPKFTAKKSNMQRAGAADWCFGSSAVSFSSC